MAIECFTHPELSPFSHGFFTRKGGASSGIFASLNCGPGSSDQSGAVTRNRALVAGHLGVEPDHLLTVHQIHSADVLTVTEPFAERPKADAMVTKTPGLALGALSADCAPVLFADEEAGVVGAAHAGWRGALGGVLEATLSAMQGLGARRITAVVGPCISQRAYEVGPEFLESFMADDPEYARFFAQGNGDRLLFDLPGFAVARLREAGANAEWTGHCTYSDPDRFYSYRRTTHAGEADYGRLISAIAIPG